jgi:hypothetical protein
MHVLVVNFGDECVLLRHASYDKDLPFGQNTDIKDLTNVRQCRSNAQKTASSSPARVTLAQAQSN